MADYWSNFRSRWGGGRFLWISDKLDLSSPETRMVVLPDTKDRTIVSSFVWTKHRNVTDGQTDRQTDGQTDGRTFSPCYYNRVHYEQCRRAVKTAQNTNREKCRGGGSLVSSAEFPKSSEHWSRGNASRQSVQEAATAEMSFSIPFPPIPNESFLFPFPIPGLA